MHNRQGITDQVASSGDKAIVVLDHPDLDTAPLRLATMWARWVVRRKLAGEEREVDIPAITGLIDEAGRTLAQHSTIKRCHTAPRNKIDEAGRHVNDLVCEVEDALERVRAKLDGE